MLETITISKSFVKQGIALILNANKLKSTINILGNKVVCKPEDVTTIKSTLKRAMIPFN